MLKVTEVLSGDVFSKVQSFHSLKKNPCEFLVGVVGKWGHV